MKTCSKCKQCKPESAFLMDSTTGRLRSACRVCLRTAARTYDRRMRGNRSESYKRCRRASGKRWRQQRRLTLRKMVDAFKAVPCADCGCSYPPYVMQFDHVDATNKTMNICEMVSRRMPTDAALRTEIAKCEVVCANCHAERTHQRRGKN